jgi:hypothetical protein
MKEFNLEEYNKMCAEFLGWEYNSQQSIHFPKGTYRDLKNVGHCAEKGLSFDSDWNKIMMVVEKIKSINVYKNNPSDATLAIIREEIRIFLGLCNKKAAVQTIWEFLQLYKESHK